ncbi:hypothetical protein RBB50_001969 [Rhinocladiella similis]
MKLINSKTFTLENFFTETAPPYAILSHTWTSEELTYQDITSDGGLSCTTKKGCAKLKQTCRLAVQDGLDYAWIDTCCIDKSSSAELSESINSMYTWYANATTCYVYLEDLSSSDSISGATTAYIRKIDGENSSNSDALPATQAARSLAQCRWFTRGWTLQELLAPVKLTFYDSSWTPIGTRSTFCDMISRITSIPKSVLSQTFPISECSIAVRMSWAAHRRTTRTEDIAYCLLGLFDVNMPLLYGEGMKAFRRLQEEIVRQSNDFTIFAWEKPPSTLPHNASFAPGSQAFGEGRTVPGLSIFAPTPSCFANTTIIDWLSKEEVSFSATNAGLLFSGTVDIRVLNSSQYILLVGLQTTSWRSRLATGIYLRKQTPTIYHRDASAPLSLLSPLECASLPTLSIRNLVVSTAPKQIDGPTFHAFRQSTIHVSSNPSLSPGQTFRLVTAIPETLWTYNEHIFLKPEIYSSENGRESAMYSMILGVQVAWFPKSNHDYHDEGDESDDDENNSDDRDDREAISLCVLCDYRKTPPHCKIFQYEAQGALGPMLFDGRHKADSVDWADVELQVPSIHDLTDNLDLTIDNMVTTISASLPADQVSISGEEVHVYSLILEARSNRNVGSA